MTRSPLRLLVFPADDKGLLRDLDAAVGRVPPEATEDEAMAAVQQDLRRWYRSLTVRERDSLGGYPDDPARVWYVYRDGRIRKHDAGLNRLYRALSEARVTVASSEAAVAGAHAVARAAGYHVDVARPGGFAPAEAVRRTKPRASAAAER